MKGLLKVVALLVLVVLSACNKENGNHSATATPNEWEQGRAGIQSAVFASKWQTLEQWQKDEKGFHALQQLPLKPKRGKVLLFARNVWAADAPMEEPMEDIPLQLPFNFLPYTDQPGVTETWQYEVKDNELKIVLKVDGGEVTPRPVQVRAVYIPDSVWSNLKESGEEAVAYQTLVEKLKIEP